MSEVPVNELIADMPDEVYHGLSGSYSSSQLKDIIKDPEGVWGKVKPKARDWRNIKPQEHLSDSNYENALFLTVTDRYHRVAMDKVNILLKDIIQTKPGQVKFCGKWYEVE